jgi:ubiquinone/menaquinone biosynthesis C-methylase UbiE
MELSKQYNSVMNDFITLNKTMNEISDKAFWKCVVPFLKENGRAIDFGCGPGDLITDISEYMECAGVDTSFEMVSFARKAAKADIRLEDFAHTTFEDKSFDLVVSKWAMQTSKNIDPIYKEAARLLKSGGHFVFLVVHPFRQFLEKKKVGKNYFKKEIVRSTIFAGAITVEEPSHTLSEYLSNLFLNEFTIVASEEGKEGVEFPAAEHIGGDIYPTYLIITAQKK